MAHLGGATYTRCQGDLLASTRLEVACIGTAPIPSLKDVCDILGFTVSACNADVIDPTTQVALRAVLVPIDGLKDARAHGVLMRLLSTSLLDFGILLAILSTDLERSYRIRTNVDSAAALETDAIRVATPGPMELADLLRNHEPGPSVSKLLAIEPEAIRSELEPSDEILLRRAFAGFKKIRIVEEPGGRSSGCRVWRVIAEAGPPQREAFIAKTAPNSSIETELKRYTDFVHEQIPFPFHAPVVRERFVKGGKRSILVSMFVGRAQRIDEYLLAKGCNPNGVINSLFTDALGPWRTHSDSVNASIGRIFVDRERNSRSDAPGLQMSLLPNPANLASIHLKCQNAGKPVVPPEELYGRIAKLPETKFFECHGHGDLNIRNVFVRWHSTDAILIDFQQSGQLDPMARDLSKLETSIALTAKDRDGERLANEELLDLYAYPLLPPIQVVSGEDSRMAAIRQIRRHACGEGISNTEFALLSMCHLLRFSVEPPDPTPEQQEFDRQRPICYELACKLSTALETPH